MLASKNVNVKNMQFDVIKKLCNLLLAKIGAKMSFFSLGKKNQSKNKQQKNYVNNKNAS